MIQHHSTGKAAYKTLLNLALVLGLLVALFAPALSTSVHAADKEEPTGLTPVMEGLRMGAPFAENAVLQRDMAVPVWGWCEPGTELTVHFAGQSKHTQAGDDGKWMVKLDPMPASFEPRNMTINTAMGQNLTIKGMLVGEVWLASGQSNMQYAVTKTSSRNLVIKPRNNVPPIREFQITSCYAQPQPIEKAVGHWNCGNYTDYSAIILAFADTLYQQLDVPIGILNCSFSETSIQAWIPRVGFAAGTDEYTQGQYKRVLIGDPGTPEHKAAWGAFYQAAEDTLKENAELVKKGEVAHGISTKLPGNYRGNRDATWLFNARLNPVVPYAMRGCIWNQGYANMNEGLPYYHNLHSLIRGWRAVWDRPDLPVYFHQFYTPGEGRPEPSISTTSEMRLGTWMARDIPNTNMASQIDIGGGIHYFNKAVPGYRLALLALKNQYPDTVIQPPHDAPAIHSAIGRKAADLIAEGPMFNSYVVEGNKLIVSFDHAADGLVVAETGTNAKGKPGFADPKIIPNGDDKVKLFYLADADRVWHPASMKIDGTKVILTAPGVDQPMGVSYATGGIAWQANLYNKGLLPTTPFIYYDHKMVTRDNWPDPKLKVAGETIDPDTVGIVYEWRKMPLISTQFKDNAVLQAGQPITFFGSVLHDWGHEAEGKTTVEFEFNGIKKTFPATPGENVIVLGPHETRFGSGLEWRVTVPPMPASDQPKTLTVRFLIDGDVAHEETFKNIVVGDVWFVAAPAMPVDLPKLAKTNPMVRVMARGAKRSADNSPSRYSIAVSRNPDSRFAAEWDTATEGFAAELGAQIHAKTGKPVGIIFMENTRPKGGSNPPLKSWIPYEGLKGVPSLQDDFNQISSVVPGNDRYDANVHRYLNQWKQYWTQYIPQLIADKAVSDDSPWGSAWGHYPLLGGDVHTTATQTYNVLVHSFTPAGLKGIVFLTSPDMFKQDQGADFGQQMTALINSWLNRFGGEPAFFHTMPDQKLAPKITQPKDVRGSATAITLTKRPTDKQDTAQLQDVIKQIITKAYP